MNSKDRKTVILSIGIILAITLWFFERIKQIPQYGLVFYEMGLNCDDNCGQDKQLQYFQKAVYHTAQLSETYFDPRISDAHYRLALLYENMGNHDKAFSLFIKATEFSNENTLAHYKTGVHYFQKGDYQTTLKYLRQAYKLGKFPDVMHYYLARAYDETQDYELAIVYYINILNLDDEYSSEIYQRLTSIHSYHKDDVDSLTQRNRSMGNHEYVKLLEQSFKKALAFEFPQ